jgi:heat shock protein HslJ
MARRLMLAAIAALLLAVPASSEAASPLAGTSWTVKRVNGRAMPAREHARLNFEARRFGGFFACNHQGGRYRTDGSRLRFSDLVSTAMGCERDTPPPNFTDAIRHARFYRLTGNRLLLLGARGRTLARLARR